MMSCKGISPHDAVRRQRKIMSQQARIKGNLDVQQSMIAVAIKVYTYLFGYQPINVLLVKPHYLPGLVVCSESYWSGNLKSVPNLFNTRSVIMILSLSTLLLGEVFSSYSGNSATPLMGFNTYNDVGCSPNDTHIRDTLYVLKKRGFLDAGYNYFQVDCGWQGFERDGSGALTYDDNAFPHGITPLSDLARGLGFKWSMYTDLGDFSCDTQTVRLRPGSLGHEKEDAAAFKKWNTEFVKVDNCYIHGNSSADNAPKTPRKDFLSRYSVMSNALASYGVGQMTICQWGVPYISSSNQLEGPGQWAPLLSTTSAFRISDDISDSWESVSRISNEMINVARRNLSRSGSFADMDALEVGNGGLTIAEAGSHFALWAFGKSPLFVSTEISKLTECHLDILLNKDIIAINQDPLGIPVSLIQRHYGEYDLYSGPLANGDIAVLAVDLSNVTRPLTIEFSHLGVASAKVKNLWSPDTEMFSRPVTAVHTQDLAPHGSVALRLSNVTYSIMNWEYIWYQANSALKSGNFTENNCSGCSDGKKVSLFGNSSITFSGINSSCAEETWVFEYIYTTVNYLADNRNNTVNVLVSVNSGPSQYVSLPLSGYDNDKDVFHEYLVDISGFRPGDSNNTLLIQSISEVTVSFDRIGMRKSI